MLATDRYEGPAVRAPRHSLIDSGNVITPPNKEWENGITFTPKGCYDILAGCIDCPPLGLSDLQGCQDEVTFVPYLLDLGVSLYSTRREGVSEMIESSLDAGSSSVLEAYAWAGCPEVDNPVLADGTSLGGGTTPILALARMATELISATGHGGAQGTIYMSPMVAVPVSEQLYKDADGNVRTKIGEHLVIIGNFPMTSIAGHIGEVDVYLGDPFIAAGQDTFVSSNLTELRWSRTAAAVWNPCGVFTQTISQGGG